MPEESLEEAFELLHQHFGERWVGTEGQGRTEMAKTLQSELGYDKRQAKAAIDTLVTTRLLRYHLLHEAAGEVGANPAVPLGLGYWQIGRE